MPKLPTDQTTIVVSVFREDEPFRAMFIVAPDKTNFDMRLMIGDPEDPEPGDPPHDPLASLVLTEKVFNTVIRGLKKALQELELQKAALN